MTDARASRSRPFLRSLQPKKNRSRASRIIEHGDRVLPGSPVAYTVTRAHASARRRNALAVSQPPRRNKRLSASRCVQSPTIRSVLQLLHLSLFGGIVSEPEAIAVPTRSARLARVIASTRIPIEPAAAAKEESVTLDGRQTAPWRVQAMAAKAGGVADQAVAAVSAAEVSRLSRPSRRLPNGAPSRRQRSQCRRDGDRARPGLLARTRAENDQASAGRLLTAGASRAAIRHSFPRLGERLCRMHHHRCARRSAVVPPRALSSPTCRPKVAC